MIHVNHVGSEVSVNCHLKEPVIKFEGIFGGKMTRKTKEKKGTKL